MLPHFFAELNSNPLVLVCLTFHPCYLCLTPLIPSVQPSLEITYILGPGCSIFDAELLSCWLKHDHYGPSRPVLSRVEHRTSLAGTGPVFTVQSKLGPQVSARNGLRDRNFVSSAVSASLSSGSFPLPWTSGKFSISQIGPQGPYGPTKILREGCAVDVCFR